MASRLLPTASALLFLSACAQGGDFPSLAPRPVEQLSLDEPVRETADAPADTALGARIDSLLAEARAGDSEFREALASAGRPTGGAEGSETWIEAQMAQSRLEAARERTLTALADLDALVLERTGMATSAADLARLDEARRTVQALADEQQQTLR